MFQKNFSKTLCYMKNIYEKLKKNHDIFVSLSFFKILDSEIMQL